jgi:hypothetical protein
MQEGGVIASNVEHAGARGWRTLQDDWLLGVGLVRKPKSIFRSSDHQELWRPASDFIGPMMPPMMLWLARGCPKSAWEVVAEDRHRAARAAESVEQEI